MTAELRIEAIARQLVDDVEELAYVNPRLSANKYDKAVRLVLDAFNAAHAVLRTVPDYSTQGDSAFYQP